MRQTIFALTLANGRQLLWGVGTGAKRFPIIKDDGRFRIVNTSKPDGLQLLDVLDAIMIERRADTYPRKGVCAHTSRVERIEVEMPAWEEARWSVAMWGTVAFSDYDIDLGYYQKQIDRARRSLVRG